MAKITWLGEDGPEGPGPSYTTCFSLKFPKGEAIDVTDESVIARAKRNKFFKVSEEPEKRGPGRPPKVVEPDVEDQN